MRAHRVTFRATEMYYPDQMDSDDDGLGDACDNCPEDASSDQPAEPTCVTVQCDAVVPDDGVMND